jgi:hypothetical protein
MANMSTEELGHQLDAMPVGTAEEERRTAKAWYDTAERTERDREYWMDRALKAEGWTGSAERDALGAIDAQKPWAIIDCRSIVGNTPLFWMPNSAGYGSVISEIGRYSEAEAKRKRETDYPVPLEMVIKCARPRVDIQLLNRELEAAGMKPPLMGWGHPPRCVDCERKAKIPRRR